MLLDGRNVKVDKYPNGNFVGPTVIADVKVRAKEYLKYTGVYKPNMIRIKAQHDML